MGFLLLLYFFLFRPPLLLEGGSITNWIVSESVLCPWFLEQGLGPWAKLWWEGPQPAIFSLSMHMNARVTFPSCQGHRLPT